MNSNGFSQVGEPKADNRRLRILVLTDRYPIAPSHSPSTWMLRSFQELNRFADIQVISVINILPRLKNLLFPGRDWVWLKRALARRIETEGTSSISVLHFRALGPPARLSWRFLPRCLSWQLFRRILSATSSQQFDLMLSHCTYPSGHLALKIGRALGLPVIVINHEGWRVYQTYSGPAAVSEIRDIIRSATAIVALSQNHRWELQQDFPTQSIHCVPLGIDVIPIKSPPSQHKEFRIITASRLDGNQKRISLLIEAFAAFVRTTMDDSLLTIAGDGNDLIHLKRLVGRIGLTKRVQFVGWLPSDKLRLLMQDHDVYVCSSDFETFGYAVLEAASIGLPVVGLHDVGILTGFVSLFPNELSLDQLSISSVQEKLTRLCSDEAQRKIIGKAMIAKVRNDFSWDVHRIAMQRVVESTLQHHRTLLQHQEATHTR